MNDLIRTKKIIIGKDKKSIVFDRTDLLANICIKQCVIPELDGIKRDLWFSTLRNYRLRISLGVKNGQPVINTIGFETLLQPKHQFPTFKLESIFNFYNNDYISIEFEILTADSKPTELNFEFTFTKTETLRERKTHDAVGMGLLSNADII